MWWSDTFFNGSWQAMWIIAPLMMILCMAMMTLMMRRHGTPRHSEDSDAVAILKARFARGDITRSEYEEQRRMLEI